MSAPLPKRDHGGGLDAAVAEFGGEKAAWLDLSTGINPVAYPVGQVSDDAWARLPDEGAMDRLLSAARRFWNVPDEVEIIAAAGASPLIARMPDLAPGLGAYIPAPTYNEHAAAFSARGQLDDPSNPQNPVHVYVHPNNPDGRMWPASDIGGRPLTVVDESFCDTVPEQSHMARAAEPGVIVLKSFGKFWGLAGVRLGFAMALPETFAPSTGSLQELMGPWSVSGPALEIGARALMDLEWADATRMRLARDAARLDALMLSAGAELVGGTTLFRTYAISDGAGTSQARLAKQHIWSRIFPYSTTWMRLGLPGTEADWARLEAAL